MRVLVDTIDADGAVARSPADAPDIDGMVRIARPGKFAAGDWVDVTITGFERLRSHWNARAPFGRNTCDALSANQAMTL